MQAKLALVLLTHEFARRADPLQVAFNCAHPGVNRTNLGRAESPWWLEAMRPFMRHPRQAAAELLPVLTDDSWHGVSGGYLSKGRQARSSPPSYSPAEAARLWKVSEELVFQTAQKKGLALASAK